MSADKSPFTWRGQPSAFMRDKHFNHGRHADKIELTRDMDQLPHTGNTTINMDQLRPSDKNARIRKGTI